jgi:UDP:flavonoid glycosyltransferase YjiC (YdhE family)
VKPTLAARADSDVTVVAALGSDLGALSGPVPPNARAAEFIPFDELLPKASVFITNGGSGGLHQALAAGVPAIVAGETDDKPANAVRVEYHGLGINLRTATPSPNAIKDAMDRLLKDQQVRENVRRLATIYAAHDAVAEIERLTLTADSCTQPANDLLARYGSPVASRSAHIRTVLPLLRDEPTSRRVDAHSCRR